VRPGVTLASDELRRDILMLKKARDAVETDAIPASYEGLGRLVAEDVHMPSKIGPAVKARASRIIADHPGAA